MTQNLKEKLYDIYSNDEKIEVEVILKRKGKEIHREPFCINTIEVPSNPHRPVKLTLINDLFETNYFELIKQAGDE